VASPVFALAEVLAFLSRFLLAFLDFGGLECLWLRRGTTHPVNRIGGGTGAQNKSPSPFAVSVSAPHLDSDGSEYRFE
jgi:hypothetical protein